MKIKDNYLPFDDYIKLSKSLLGESFPWFYSPWVVDPEDRYEKNELDHYQLYHLFYDNAQEPYVQSGYLFETLKPLLQVIGCDIRALVRIKANNMLRRSRIIKHGYHVDYPWDDCTTSIYYVNTNDGYTEFEDGTKVESVANRLITFPSSMKHTGTTCTDSKNRVVINFNYF